MPRIQCAALLLLLIAGCEKEQPVATFSIVAYDPATKELGIAVQSKFFGVGSVVPWARAGVGAVATQAFANVAYGPEGLRLMAAGRSATDALGELTDADPRQDRRQVGIVDAKGRAAAFTGEACIVWAGHKVGEHYCVQGNILANATVVEEMAKAFEAARKDGGRLADWLLAGLQAGQKAGGDRRGMQSAAMLVVREGAGYGGGNDRFIDLRVDDHKQPIEELGRLLEMHKKVFAPVWR